jgi:hypothetical protein
MANAEWGPDIKLSTSEVSATLHENMGHCIVATGEAVHVVWCDLKNSGQGIYYKRSLDKGVTWGPETRISARPSSDQWPLLAVSGGSLHLVFCRDFDTPRSASYYQRSKDGGNTWEPEVLLGQTKWWPGVAATGSMVYVSLNTLLPDGNSEVYFRRSNDNGTTWQPQQQISNAPGRSEDPAIAANGSYVYLVWNDNRNGNMDVYYRRSSDRGETWGPETSLTHAHAFAYMPTIDAAGPNVHVVYGIRSNRGDPFHIFHLHCTDFGATWGAPEQLPQPAGGGLYPAIVRDNLNLHVVWGAAGAIMYLHSANGGASWTPVVSLVNGSSPRWPFLAAAEGTVHLIWVDMRDGHGAVYYKRQSQKK